MAPNAKRAIVFLMTRRKVRDIYGNWTWEEDESEGDMQPDANLPKNEDVAKKDQDEDAVKLEWKDWIALTIASLETILLPVVVIVVILVILAIVFAHFA